MNQTPMDEDAWWSTLAGADILDNTAGNPPYRLGPVVARILLAHPAPRRMLDMGCGEGRLTNEIAYLCDPIEQIIYGFDISSPLVHRAVRNAPPNVRYWHSDGRRFPAGMGGDFDLIWSVTMFQHIPHDAKWNYVDLARQRLTPNGALIFTVAVGDEPPSFLNHQFTNEELGDFAGAMTDLFETVTIDGPDRNGWTWVEAHR